MVSYIVGLIALMNYRGLLSSLAFPPYKKIAEVPLQLIQSYLMDIFKNWGKPSWIKVDNGRPFGDPQLEIVPVLALWLISLGIKVIWNKPRSPKENAKVERSQGVLSNWTEFQKCRNASELQQRVREEADFHNYFFPIKRLEKKKRIEVFPDLKHSGRKFDPENLDLYKALFFLSEGTWERNISSYGQVTVYGHRFQVGTKYHHQQVSIKLDAKSNAWKIFDSTGNLLKTMPTKFSIKRLWNLDLS
jgi:hypothetical protein